MRLIDADAVDKAFQKILQKSAHSTVGWSLGRMFTECRRAVDNAETWEGQKLIETYKWTISQLNDLGYQFGEKIKESDKVPDKEIAIKPIESTKFKGFYNCQKCFNAIHFLGQMIL